MPTSHPFSMWTLSVSGVLLGFGQEHFTLVLCEHAGLSFKNRLFNSQIIPCIFSLLLLITFICLLKLTKIWSQITDTIATKKTNWINFQSLWLFWNLDLITMTTKNWELILCSSIIIYLCLSFFICKIMVWGSHCLKSLNSEDRESIPCCWVGSSGCFD